MAFPTSQQPRTGRIRSIHMRISSTAFDVLFLLFLALLALHVGLDLYEQVRDRTPVYSKRIDFDAYTIADKETAAAIVREFDRRAAGGVQGHGLGEFDYQPWVEFAERPYSGQYLNVDEHFGYTTRRTSPPSQAAAGAEELVVWAFGGSTLFGFGMNDDQTVASHLQRELQHLLTGYRIRVVNHAHGWWYSSQEVAHFIALLRIESCPDVAVFLDGVNDLVIVGSGYEPTYYTSMLWDAWQAERDRRRYPAPRGTWLEFTQSFPPTRIQRLLGSKRLTLQALTPSLTHPSRFRAKPPNPVLRMLEVHRTNRRIATTVADAFGIQVHFFLQPMSSFRESRDRQPWRVDQVVYDAFIEEAREDSSLHFDSLHDVLNGLDKAYIDTYHYNETASQILGARMAERIAREWTSRNP